MICKNVDTHNYIQLLILRSWSLKQRHTLILYIHIRMTLKQHLFLS